MAAEYVMAGGNYQVVLCERGIRTFCDHSRNTLDLSVIPPAKKLSHLPILVDPSHGTGKRDFVPPMSLAAVAAGADGLLVEVHPDPDHAQSDGAQTLDFAGFDKLMESVKGLAKPLGRSVVSTLRQSWGKQKTAIISNHRRCAAVPTREIRSRTRCRRHCLRDSEWRGQRGPRAVPGGHAPHGKSASGVSSGLRCYCRPDWRSRTVNRPGSTGVGAY